MTVDIVQARCRFLMRLAMARKSVSQPQERFPPVFIEGLHSESPKVFPFAVLAPTANVQGFTSRPGSKYPGSYTEPNRRAPDTS